MPYQNIGGSPRFYVDHGLWLHTLGLYTPPSGATSLIHLNPSNMIDAPPWNQGISIPRYAPINYIAYLGHDGGAMFPSWDNAASVASITSHINGSDSQGTSVPYNGFSIYLFEDTEESYLLGYIGFGQHIGAISIGSTYTMPNAPNLSLTMSREYGLTKEFTTYNGSSMSNSMITPNKWGDLGAWELGDGNPALSKSGRRTWQLTFSYMGSDDLWGSNQSLSFIREDITDGTDSGDLDDDGNFQYNLLTDDNFFSQVWQRTLGMTLPCILQIDSSNNNPDQFAIVRGVSNSLKATQSAPSVYDISLSIEEVF